MIPSRLLIVRLKAGVPSQSFISFGVPTQSGRAEKGEEKHIRTVSMPVPVGILISRGRANLITEEEESTTVKGS